MKLTVLLLTILFSISAFSRITDNQVNIKISAKKIEMTTNAGFHFNAEAPANAKFDDLKAIFKPSTKTEKLFVYEVPEKTKIAKLDYYVCDDKKTVCEKHEKEITLDGKSQAPTSHELKRDIAADLKSDKQTLLVFSAPWCPACLRMETETYPKKDVALQLKKMNVKKVNIDLPENSELSEKFHVKAIPTLILLNRDGDELTRWLDFQPPKKFAADLKSNLKKVATLAALEKKASAGDESAASERGMLAFISYQCEDAVKWLSKSKKEKDVNYKLAAEVQCAEELKPEVQIKTLENAITKTTSKLDKVRWTVDLLEKQKEQKAKPEEIAGKAATVLAELESFSKSDSELRKTFANSTYGEYGGFEQAEALWIKGKLLGLLGNEPEKKAAMDASKAAIEKISVSVDRPGEMLLAIAYLREAEEKVRVQEMYQQLLNKYPETYVYHEKYSRYQLKNKNYDDALKSVNKALQFAQGNEPQLNLLKARILGDMKNKVDALSVVNEVLKLENINHKKYKKTLAALQTLKTDLEKQ